MRSRANRGFIFDANRCTGCQACRLACVIENDLEPETAWRRIHTFNERRIPGVPRFHLSLACHHCARPACLEACPALAYSKDAATGAVLIDEARCIGCRYCSWACPYDAPRMDAVDGVMTKCTFCHDRIRRGLQPACVELCPTGALRYDVLPEEAITHRVEGFPPSNLRPSIRVVPLREGRRGPEVSEEAPEMPFAVEPGSAGRPSVSLRSEWSLAVFTFLGAALFASVASAVAGGPALHPVAFLAAAVMGLALGAVHLGRRRLAWRAVLGVARSWLSREIVLFSSFVVLGVAYLGWVPGSRVGGGIALLVGLAALFSMDRVYRFAVRPLPSLPHSAGVLLTGLFLASVLARHPGSAALIGVVKLLLYAARKIDLAGRNRPVHPELSVLRVGCGFLFPALLWTAAPPGAQVFVMAAILVAELIDRCEFYTEIEFASPDRQMREDLARVTRARAAGRLGPRSKRPIPEIP
jgi:Fe-S-cluster-containing dehydrogenase component/DMSO reductase anchor subunit